jgi:iron complex transport system ATP-binding protein
MPQQSLDSFSFSAREAVAIGRTPWRTGSAWDSAEDEDCVHAALTQVGMEGWIDNAVTSLSGGERQRVAFAALLAQQPALMLLDEPTAHQDVAQQLLLMQLMRRLTAHHAVIASCHDINLAARFATHVLLLGPGFHRAGPASTVLTPEALAQTFGCSFDRSGDLFTAS